MNLNYYIGQLPDRQTLKKICKGQAVLDWIICGQEFERYHIFLKSESEEYDGNEAYIGLNFEDTDGPSVHLYFSEKGCIIVPSECDSDKELNNAEFEKKIPEEFKAFYKKNYSGKDIPFVIYTEGDNAWKSQVNFQTEDLIYNLDHLSTDPEFYKEWAIDMFEEDTAILEDMNSDTISEIYEGRVLTEQMVLSIVSKVEDWSDLENALNEIPYRFDF